MGLAITGDAFIKSWERWLGNVLYGTLHFILNKDFQEEIYKHILLMLKDCDYMNMNTF